VYRRESEWADARYELRHTIDAPNETFATSASSADVGHRRESDGTARKRMQAAEPTRAKRERRRCRM